MEKLLWWLDRESIAQVGQAEIRSFMLYLCTGHNEPEGQFGNPRLRKPLSDRSVKNWHGNLSTLFTFLVSEGYLDGSPMERLTPPIHRPDQVQLFTEEQVQALIRPARKSRSPKRNEAFVLFQLFTG